MKCNGKNYYEWKLLLINGFGYLKKPWIIDNLVYYSLNYQKISGF